MQELVLFTLLGSVLSELFDILPLLQSRADSVQLPSSAAWAVGVVVRIALGLGLIFGAEAVGIACNNGTAFLVGLASPRLLDTLRGVAPALADFGDGTPTS